MSRHTPTAHVSKRAFPTTKSELLDLIESLCPEPLTVPGQPDDEIMFAAGRRSVVHELRNLFKDSFALPGDAA